MTNILVVDDAIVARKMIKRHLTGSPFEAANIVEAVSGENGLELFNQEISAVLSDWNMPGISGLDFVKEVRALEQQWGRDENSRVPIIMITTEGTVQKISHAKEAGVDAYIVKPFSATQLIDALNGLLEG